MTKVFDANKAVEEMFYHTSIALPISSKEAIDSQCAGKSLQELKEMVRNSIGLIDRIKALSQEETLEVLPELFGSNGLKQMACLSIDIRAQLLLKKIAKMEQTD